MKVIDLSHLLTNGMPVYPGTPPVVLQSMTSVASDGFNELQLQFTTHIGTHVDCPHHIMNDGFDTTAEIDHFYGKGIMLNCVSQGSSISLSFLKRNEKIIGTADFVLFCTQWDRNWLKPDYFGNFPVLSNEAAEYLVKFKLKGLGIDAPSFDTMNSTELPIHHILLNKGCILIENLTNLKSLPDAGFIFSCLPLKLENGDGCPVRAAAILDE